MQKYIKDINEACGEGREYVVTLKYDKRDEVIQKVLSKSELISSTSGVLVKARYKGKDISIVRSGKMLFKNMHSIEELKSILAELLEH